MNRKRRYPDLILGIALFLALIGLYFVFDTSYVVAGQREMSRYDPLFFFRRQMVWLGFGLLMMVLGYCIPYSWWRRGAWPIFFCSLLALGLVFIPGIGKGANGAHRWIDLKIFQYQPAETAKFAVVLLLAHWCSASRRGIRSFWWDVVPKLAVLCLPLLLIVIEPDLGTALVVYGAGLAVLFCAGLKPSHILALLVLSSVGILGALYMEPYRIKRLIALLDPWQFYHTFGYQMVHSLIAIGSGGWFGQGLMRGVQKFFYLPEAHTDFVFATIGEETGFLGSLVLLALFLLYIFRGFTLAYSCKDPFGSLLAGGLTAIVGFQALLNIAVASGSAPVAGVPLPFISYGGTALVSCLFYTGILGNIAKESVLVAVEEMDEGRHQWGRHRGASLSRSSHSRSPRERSLRRLVYW